MNYIREKMSLDTLYKNDMYGQNTTVAVLDTGVYPHLDFCIGNNRLVDFVDVTEMGEKMTLDIQKSFDILKEPFDNNGHGTVVSGILCGSGAVSNGKYKGVAPMAKLVGVKTINDNGEGDGRNILFGMQYILSNSLRLGIRVACMSFGSTIVDPDPFIIGVETLWDNGIVVVASSGNDGPATKTIKSPAASPKIISVGGATFDKNGNPIVTDFSSRGPFGKFTRPDLVAPAVDIISTDNKGHYKKMTGTSMAAPIIAGVVACVLSKYPNYTPDKIKDLLINSTAFVDDDPNSSGYGIIDIQKLVKNL